MSETIEFPFVNQSPVTVPVEPPTKSSPESGTETDTGKQPFGSDITAYYGEDHLATSVLRGKYLAPWEKSPRDLWLRIAAAAATVEKDSQLWETRFSEILNDFRFVPGGRIMHGRSEEHTSELQSH